LGPVIHGSDVNPVAPSVLVQNLAHKNAMLLGIPMVHAHLSEPEAPPFGVAIHSSANAFLDHNERKWSSSWWPWFSLHNNAHAQSLKGNLPNYFDWCASRAGVIGYEISRITVHKVQAAQYFVDA